MNENGVPVIDSRHGRRWGEFRLLLLLLFAITALQLATLRPNVPLGSDAAMYLLHARNIVEGRPYADTGYIVNPSRPDHSPVTYPPGLPVLIAPVYAFAGLDLRPYKVELALLLVLACVAVYAVARPRIGHLAALATAAGLGFLPYAARFKNDILSDIPFLVFLYLALWYVERQLTSELSTAQRLRRGVVAGVLVFIATAMRSLGVFVLPALLAAEWLGRRKRWPLLGIAAAATCCVLLLAQEALIADTATYLSMPAPDRDRIVFQSVLYVRILRDMWNLPVPASIRSWTFGLFCAASLIGWLSRLRRPGVLELFAPIYLGVIMLAPVFGGHRYLLPVIPLQMLFAIVGVAWLARRAGRRRRAVALALAVLVSLPIIYSFGQGQRFLPRGPMGTGYDAPAVTGMVRFLVSNTPPDAVILSNMPRTIALLTGRRSVIHERPGPGVDQWPLIEAFGIRTLVLELADPAEERALRPFLEHNVDRVQRVFQNGQFEVWTIRTATGSW